MSIMLANTDDVRIQELRELTPPASLMHEIPVNEVMQKTVRDSRQSASDIIHGRDDRLLLIVGPCSIHDTQAAHEYAKKLATQIKKHKNELHIIMRVYFEKPRTTIGWKGLINDPHLDNSFDINAGLKIARELLANLAEMGISSAVEFLDTITPQYLCDLVSWGAIGARTTESQVHRQLASGLSMPIGFKNGTDGNIQIAIDAVGAAKHVHHFLSVTKAGNTAIVKTMGNNDCHVILRGSNSGPNYDEKSIIQVAKTLDRAKLPPKVMIDCSHGNSQKDHTRQALVLKSIAQQIASGSHLVIGAMLESHLHAGNQALVPNKALKYGVSVTDACIDWEETEILLAELAQAVKQRRELVNDTDALSQVRRKIDLIDQSLEELINERAEQALEVLKIKSTKNKQTTLYRPEREAAIIRKVLERNKGPLSDTQMEDIFRQIMTACLNAEER